MILQNLSRAIREQNYYAVFLEFVIVIAGVVIGFQVQAWAQDQAEQREEQAVLQRLLDESHEAIAYIDAEIATSVRSLNLLDQAVAALNSGTLGDLTQAEFVNGIWRSARYPALTPPRAVVDEIVTGGRIGLIEDPAIREALSRYQRSIDNYTQQLPYFRSVADQPDKLGGAAFASVYRPDLPERRETRANFEVLASDDRFVREMTGSLYGQLAMISNRRSVRTSASNLCHAVAEDLERVCQASPMIVEVLPGPEDSAP